MLCNAIRGALNDVCVILGSHVVICCPILTRMLVPLQGRASLSGLKKLVKSRCERNHVEKAMPQWSPPELPSSSSICCCRHGKYMASPVKFWQAWWRGVATATFSPAALGMRRR
jgi:hypothetical protein